MPGIGPLSLSTTTNLRAASVRVGLIFDGAVPCALLALSADSRTTNSLFAAASAWGAGSEAVALSVSGAGGLGDDEDDDGWRPAPQAQRASVASVSIWWFKGFLD
jgi:hypothetical protein